MDCDVFMLQHVYALVPVCWLWAPRARRARLPRCAEPESGRAEATPAAGPCGCDHVRTYETNPTQVTGALWP